MELVFATIPLMILAIAAATVPLVVAMKREAAANAAALAKITPLGTPAHCEEGHEGDEDLPLVA